MSVEVESWKLRVENEGGRPCQEHPFFDAAFGDEAVLHGCEEVGPS